MNTGEAAADGDRVHDGELEVDPPLRGTGDRTSIVRVALRSVDREPHPKIEREPIIDRTAIGGGIEYLVELAGERSAREVQAEATPVSPHLVFYPHLAPRAENSRLVRAANEKRWGSGLVPIKAQRSFPRTERIGASNASTPGIGDEVGRNLFHMLKQTELTRAR